MYLYIYLYIILVYILEHILVDTIDFTSSLLYRPDQVNVFMPVLYLYNLKIQTTWGSGHIFIVFVQQKIITTISDV